MNKAAFSALEQLGVSVWAPLDCQSATKIAQPPSQNTCQMIFPGDNIERQLRLPTQRQL